MRNSQVLILQISIALYAIAISAQSKPGLAIPDRTVIPAVLRTSVNAKDVKLGKELELTTTDDVRDNTGKILIPKQAKLTGRVTEAIQWTKDNPESRVSFVVEKAEWKKNSVMLRAFVAGDLKIYSAAGPPQPGVSEAVAAVTNVPMGPVPANSFLAEDKTVIIQMAASRELVTELVSRAHNVQIEQGSSFSLRQLNP